MKPSHWFLTLLITLLTACGGIPKRESEQEELQRFMDYAGRPVSSFSNLGGLNSWRALDRNRIVVWKGVNEAYLLTVESFCRNLEFAERIAVTSTAGTVQAGFDHVFFRDGMQRERCRIREIRPVDYRTMRQDQRGEERPRR